MHAHGLKILESVFHFMDELIRDYGDLLYMGLVYAAIPLCVWILFGGSRRKSSAGQSPAPRIIVIHQPAERTPPEEVFDPFPPPREPDCSDDNDRHWD